MSAPADDFLEYLQLEDDPDPRLITKSELLSKVRERGQSISERQLTFYVSEGLVPKSIRVGSRAGAYPQVIVSLVVWVLRSRDQGLSVDAIKELLPVWKYAMAARRDGLLDLAELEYVARQQVRSFEAVTFVPNVVMDVMTGLCSHCLSNIELMTKDGERHPLSAPETTIGFTAYRRPSDEEGKDEPATWWGYRRVSIPTPIDPREDPASVVLGLSPEEAIPPMPDLNQHGNAPATNKDHEKDEREVAVD